jgi:hypothetical protein
MDRPSAGDRAASVVDTLAVSAALGRAIRGIGNGDRPEPVRD